MLGPSQAGWFVLSRLLVATLLGAALGFSTGHTWLGIALALASYLGWELFNLYVFERWLSNRAFLDPPDAGGTWGNVVAQTVRLHRRKRFHKQRMAQLFRELRRSSASMPDGLVLLNTQLEILWFNRAAGQLLNLRRKLDFGLRIDNLLRHPELAQYLHGSQFSSPIVLQPQLAGDRWLSFQAVTYGRDQKLLLVRDVSRQAQVEAMRRDFVANASHELRSPLTVITGYLESFAADPALQDDLRPPLEEMRRQAQRMAGIVEDLLTLSQLEATVETVSGQPIDMVGLLATLRKDVLTRSYATRDIRVNVESDARLLGDARQIESAFSNLVDNAAKYTSATGQITLRWWQDRSGGYFSVTDNGLGIPSEHIPRLTERFYRVDPGRSRATGGSGLGLAIVKHVLQRHDATLEIRSEEGRGSTFTCHFPLRRISAREIAA